MTLECGNGAIDANETCDDNNTLNGDGCSATCTLETGYGCTVDTTPADGICDTEGNGSVEPVCGDGYVIAAAEECDDNNTLDADGCSATCSIEDGYVCQGDTCDDTKGPSVLNLDTDGDGIDNTIDIDDDNDGILDAVESPDCFYSAEAFVSGDRSSFLSVSTDLPMYSAAYNIGMSIDGDLNAGSNTKFEDGNPVAGVEIYKVSFPYQIELENITFQYSTTNGVFNNTAMKLQGSNDNSTWIDLNNGYTYEYDPNPDFEVFPVDQNQGSYQYYRLLGISGPSYWRGHFEAEFHVTPTYEASNYPKSGSCDSDSDGIDNHLDLDSDEDGCSDMFESRVSLITTGSSTVEGPFGANGFANSIESNDTLIADYTGTYSYEEAEDNNVSRCQAPCTDPSLLAEGCDIDGDGIINAEDLDSDNDGILNTLECNISTSAKFPSFTLADIDITVFTQQGPFTASDGTQIDVLLTAPASSVQTTGDGTTLLGTGIGDPEVHTIEFFASGTTQPIGLLGMKILLGDFEKDEKVEYFEAIMVDGSAIRTNQYDGWNGWVDASGLGINDAGTAMFVNSEGLLETTYYATGGYQGNKYLTMDLSAHAVTKMEFKLIPLTGHLASAWGWFDTPLTVSSCSSDTDGIPNYLDTDSDGDGCPDAIEGAGSFDFTDLDSNNTLGTPVDINGTPTVANGGQDSTGAYSDENNATACEGAVVCGNSIIENNETCDDNNTLNGDGCSDTCELETGYGCTQDTTPEDGICDTDGNGSVEPVCGDGYVIAAAEECDDNNTLDADGCSGTCTIEDGYLCQGDTCDDTKGPSVLTPPAPEVTVIDGNDTNGTPPTTVETNDTTPTITGTCEANLTVTVQIDGSDIAPTTTCDENGTFTMIPDTPLTEGEHNTTATQTGENNITSPTSPVDVINVDTTAPSAPTVTITEDTNNDGNISTTDELNGTVDVNITLPVDAEVNDTLTITNPDGTTTEVPVTQELIDNGYVVSYPTQTDPIIVKATVSDPLGNTSPEAMDEAVIVKEYDYSDAPLTNGFNYGTARHQIGAQSNLFIGAVAPDAEDLAETTTWNASFHGFLGGFGGVGGFQGLRDLDHADITTINADGDANDENSILENLRWAIGATCSGLLADGTVGTVTMTATTFCTTVNVTNNDTLSGQLVAWIDFNGNGEFELLTERSVVDVDANVSNDATQGNVPAGTVDQPVVLVWENQTQPATSVNTYVRVRLTTDPVFKSNHSPEPNNNASNGEVEDSAISLSPTEPVVGKDTDSDNVADNADLDDDNDGVLDTDEGLSSCPLNVTTSVSNIAEGTTVPNGTVLTTDYLMHGSTAETTMMDVDANLTMDSMSPNNGYGLTFNANTSISFTNTDAVTSGTQSVSVTYDFSQPIDITLAWQGGVFDDSEDYFITYGSEVNSTTLNNNGATGVTLTQTTSSRIDVTTEVDVASATAQLFRIDMKNVSSFTIHRVDRVGNGAAAVGGFKIFGANLCDIDTDNDGIPDHLDTNSDGDSCPDAIEGAGSFVATDLDGGDTLGTDVDANGIPNVATPGQNTTVALVDENDSTACDICGDGTVNGTDVCDDNNTIDGDGCSATCTLETGYGCTQDTTPADGICDTDGNGSVEPVCGDGYVIAAAEECDDNNTLDADGCSGTCTIEPGYECTAPTCDNTNGPSVLTPPAPEVTVIDGNDTNGTPPTTVETNDTTPTISGVCEANLTVTVQIDGADITPTTRCDENGTFVIVPSNPLPEGEHNASVTQVGENNITSPISPIDIVVIDTTAPDAPTVTITEDTNNDGNISTTDELNGTVDVNITLPANAEVGDTLTITNPDGTTTEVPVTQDMLDNGYVTTYPAQTDPIVVKATVTDPVGNTSPEGMDEAVIVDDILEPDYKPVLTVYGGIVYGAGVHDFSFDTLVLNVIPDSTYDENDPLIIRIPKNEALTLSYDSTMTLFKGDDVENNLWSFDDSDPFDYVMTYLGTDIPTDRSRFAITGTFSVEEGEVGKFILETTIKSSTGGDSNIDNNSDRDTMQKKL